MSSGGSSGNGTEMGDSSQQQQQSQMHHRFPSISQGSEQPLEQQAKHILQHLDMHTSDKQDLKALLDSVWDF